MVFHRAAGLKQLINPHWAGKGPLPHKRDFQAMPSYTPRMCSPPAVRLHLKHIALKELTLVFF